MRLTALVLLLTPAFACGAESSPLAGLPASPGLVQADDTTRWRGWRVLGTTPTGDVRLSGDDDGAVLVVARGLVADDDGAALDLAPALLARADQADVPRTGLRLDRGLLTGVHLRGNEVLVLPQRVLRRTGRLPAPGTTGLVALREAGAAVGMELGDSGLTPLGQQAVRRVLTLLDRNATGSDECAPALLRRLLRHGWLSTELRHLPSWPRLQQALASATTLVEVERWQDDSGALVEWRDAVGRRVFTWTDATGSARLQPHPTGNGPEPTRLVLHRFPAGSEPLTAAWPLSAEVWWGRRRLVRWDADGTWEVDHARWRQVLGDEGPGIAEDVLIDWRPPHVVLEQADGTVLGLATARGVLRPPQNGDSAERERFLADAARLFRDAQHLDLIGHHLFSYVHDSPEPQRPWLIGVSGATGEIHQTAGETIATVCAGVMRGDCDDLGEVYHEILTRQGRLPYLLNVPGHAACVWAERDGDVWRVRVLHTGQPLEFSGETVAEALDQAVRHFDDENPDRGTLVHLLLRFAGENTRSGWQLSSRILHDAAYAQQMIAVQREWHYHTYSQGIARMRTLMAAGEDDSAAWSELAGLYRRTGEWPAAIAAARASLARISETAPRADAWLNVLALLVRTEDPGTPSEVAKLLAFLDREFTDDGETRMQFTQRIAALLDRPHLRAVHREVVVERLLTVLEERHGELRDWARRDFDAEAWGEDGERELRRAEPILAAVRMELAHTGPHSGDDTSRRLLAVAQGWLDDLALLNGGKRSALMDSFAMAARHYRAVLGEPVFDRLLAASPLPDTWSPPLPSHGGLVQMRRNLPWVRLAAEHWAERLGDALGDRTRPLDRTRLTGLFAGLDEALVAGQRLELHDTGRDDLQRWAALVRALLDDDPAALVQSLRDNAARRDRHSDELVTDTLVTVARHLSPAAWRRALATWHEHAATRPGYFAIAWGCAVAGDVVQALEAGAFAARMHGDDHDFAAEFTYLQRVLAGGATP
jgi:hypothetical protein